MSITASNNVFPHDPDDNFLEKGGYTGNAKDLDDKINKIIYPDAFLKTVPPTKTGNLITIDLLDFKWRLNQIEYVNSNNYSTTIENATIGYNRIDIIVATKYSNFVKIQGAESIDTALEPPIPEGTLKAAFISVFGDTILDIISPIDGTIFVKKQESQDFIANYGATTVIDQINLIDDRSSISLIGSATDVKSVQLSGEFIRPGKPHFFKNRTGHDVKLWHLAGTGNIKYFFPNGLDLIVKLNEVIAFNTNANDSANVRFEYVGSSVSGPIDLSNYYTKTQADARYKIDTISYAISATTGDLVTGDTDPFNAPYNFTLINYWIAVKTAPTLSSILVDLKKNGISITSTKAGIDVTETTSLTGTTPILTITSFVKGDLITPNIYQVGSLETGKSLKLYLEIIKT